MGKRFQPPTLEQCEAYVAEKGYKYVDSNEFLLYYKMCGWVVGKSRKPMKCWHSAMALWESKRTSKKVKLYPIKGKTCSERGCGMPAVFKTAIQYDRYFCSDHLPAKVKEQYY